MSDIVIKKHHDRAIIIGVSEKGKNFMFHNIEAAPLYTANVHEDFIKDFVELFTKAGLTVEE